MSMPNLPFPIRSHGGLLSPKQLAQVIGASESSLKRWIDSGQIDASRTSGGHRRIALAEALRFIRVTGHPIIDPGTLGLNPLAADLGKPLVDRLHQALSTDDAIQARSLMVSAYAGGMALAELCDGPIRQAMERIGLLWHESESGIMVEHQATDTCLQALHALRAYLREPEPGAPIALGGAPSRDPYLLPSLMSAIILGDIGYRTVNLGPETPLETLRHAIEQHQPRLVWLAVSTADAAANLRQPLHKLSDDLLTRRISLAVGGRHAADIGLEPRSNLLRSRSLSEVAAFARGLLNAR
jgi:excisionase family DNA binding protein